MDKVKFDALTRAFATGTSRRTAIKGLFGGAVGVAVAGTHLSGARAGRDMTCTPGTVLSDCPLQNECESATCADNSCVYSGGCQGECCGGVCQECCDSSDCDGCEVCDSGTCIFACTDCQECEGINGSATCVDRSDGICCGGTWIPDGQCCDTLDCLEPVATFCSSVACIANLCTVIPDCPDDQLCCGYGQEGAYCAECCDNSDCYIAGPCSTCEQGWCSTPECCYDSDCPDCSYCSQWHMLRRVHPGRNLLP